LLPFFCFAFAAEERRGGRAGWWACARRRNFKGTAVEFVRSIGPVRAIMLKIASSLVASLPPFSNQGPSIPTSAPLAACAGALPNGGKG
jgi:hypothetical protein